MFVRTFMWNFLYTVQDPYMIELSDRWKVEGKGEKEVEIEEEERER